MPSVVRNIFSVKIAARNGTVSIFEANNPRLETADITVPLCREDDDLNSFKLDLIAVGYAGKELAINAVASAQASHRRQGHPN